MMRAVRHVCRCLVAFIQLVKFSKKTRLPFDDIHVAASFEAMLCVTPSTKHKTLVRWYVLGVCLVCCV